MKLELYLDLEGVFRESFRNCDSNWSLVTDAELADAQAAARKIIDSGEKDAWLSKQDERRKEIGQTTTVVATL